MSKRQNNTKKIEKVPFSDIVWVIDNLSNDELAMHDKEPMKAEDGVLKLSELVELGFKVSVKWDDYNDCMMISAVCDDKRYDNAGLAVSARGDDLIDCVSILVFKVFVVADSDLRGFADKKPKGVRG